MSFLHPEFLYFMLPILLLLFSMLLTQQELKESIFSAEALRKLSVDVDQFSSKTRNVFYLLMFFFLILALASPVIERGHAVTALEDDTFYIAIQSSQKDFYKSQERAKAVLTQLRGAKVGLLIYGEESYLVSPPTQEYALLEQYIMTLEPRFSGTSYEVLLQSVDLLMDNNKSKQLIVISDGNLTILRTLAMQKSINIIRADEVHYEGAEHQEKPIYFYLFIIPISLAMIMLLIATSSFHRGEEHYVPSLVLIILMSSVFEPLHAELLSYKTLARAQYAYGVGSYEQSADIFKRYGIKMESEEAIYNAANSLYKAEHYKKALVLYQSIHFIEADKNHALYHNIGNCLVALGTEKNLREAISMYEKALHFKEVAQTRENLEWVQKELLSIDSRVKKEKAVDNNDITKTPMQKKSNAQNVLPTLGTVSARYYKIELKQ